MTTPPFSLPSSLLNPLLPPHTNTTPLTPIPSPSSLFTPITNTHPGHTTGSTVYLQRRPFHPDRFADLVEDIASANYAALENTLTGDSASSTGAAAPSADFSTASKDATAAAESNKEELTQVVTGLLRSKGFVWLACTDQAALYFSHAGM